QKLATSRAFVRRAQSGPSQQILKKLTIRWRTDLSFVALPVARRPRGDEVMTIQQDRMKSILAGAAELQSPAERQAYLAKACGGDEALRLEIIDLLGHHAVAGDFLESPAAEAGPTLDFPIADSPSTVIGPYKLLEQIGEGGFGVVYMAEQTQPVRRKVALKLLKPGMDTRQVVARFEAERQALAIMDHPNIAKVF